MATMLASDADLLDAIEAFRKHHGIPVTTFGRMSVGDANLIADMRDGRELRRATLAKVRGFMASYTSPASQQAAA